MKKALIFLLLTIFPFITFAAIVGDVNGDGNVTVLDYIAIRKHGLKYSLLTGEKLKRADVSGDGKVSNLDYKRIREIILAEASKKDVKGLILNKTKVSLKVGGSVKLVSTVIPGDAKNKKVTYKSSNTSIATVDSNGNITGKGKGTAKITATTYNGISKSVEVTVTTTTVAVTSIKLDKTSLSLKVNETATLKATVSPDNATDKTVTWTSSDTSIATVSSGKVTAKKAGKATITAKSSNGIEAKCTVTVTTTTTAVTEITLDKTSWSLEVGGSKTLKATVSPNNATDKTVTWTSSNKSVVTVDKNGNIKGLKLGTAKITAKSGNKTATCTVTVISIDLTTQKGHKAGYIYNNENLIPKVDIKPDSAINKTITWESSNPSIASVDQNGKVTANKEGKTGTVTIKASIDDVSSTFSISVLENKPSVAYRSKTLYYFIERRTKIEQIDNKEIENKYMITYIRVDNAYDQIRVALSEIDGDKKQNRDGTYPRKLEPIHTDDNKGIIDRVVKDGKGLIAINASGMIGEGNFSKELTEIDTDGDEKTDIDMTGTPSLLYVRNYGNVIRNSVNDTNIVTVEKKVKDDNGQYIIDENGEYKTELVDMTVSSYLYNEQSKRYVYGITKDNILKHYVFKEIKSSNDAKTKVTCNNSTQKKTECNNAVIAQIEKDEVKDTFGLTPVLYEKNKGLKSGEKRDRRQAICQVDKNNFIIFTSIVSKEQRDINKQREEHNPPEKSIYGFSYNELSSLMRDMNCTIGLNTDGGGSTSFFYKTNDSKVKKINTYHDGRKFADVLYFAEQ